MLAFATVSTLLVWQSRPNESAALPVELIDGDTVRLAVKPILQSASIHQRKEILHAVRISGGAPMRRLIVCLI